MTGWFASGNSELEQQIERATSSSLEDIALNLEISDLIRSKTVQPKEAMRSLKKRIDNKNPNVQLAALNLTDTCVKNGGAHFIQEIASREFIDNLVSLLRPYGAPPLNEQVKAKILELIQAWSIFAEGRYNLTVVTDAYRDLKRDGYNFPPRVEVAQSMFDSNAPPEWADSDLCMRCRTAFTMLNRKHHCRNCGNVFCGSCSGKSIPLPHLGIVQPVRVDDGCFARINEKNRPAGLTRGFDPPKPVRSLYQGSMEPRSARAEEGFDAELKRALELSLEESKSSAHASSVTPLQQRQELPVRSSSRTKDDEADPELRAAIEASIRDMEEQKKKHTVSLQQQQPSVAGADGVVVAAPPKRDHELSLVEMENISLFSNLVERLQHQPPGTVLREPQIQELYESIGTLRPKLARTYGETMSKHDTLLDLHSKLSTVVRYYDRMLEERFSNTYGNHQYSGYAQQSQQQPSHQQAPASIYPSLAGAAPSNAYSVPSTDNYYAPQALAPSDPYAAPQSVYSQPQAPPPNLASPYSQYAQPHPSMYAEQQARGIADRQRRGSASSGRASSLKYRQPSSDRIAQTPSRASSLHYPPQQQQSQYPLHPHQVSSIDGQSTYQYSETAQPSYAASTPAPPVSPPAQHAGMAYPPLHQSEPEQQQQQQPPPQSYAPSMPSPEQSHNSLPPQPVQNDYSQQYAQDYSHIQQADATSGSSYAPPQQAPSQSYPNSQPAPASHDQSFVPQRPSQAQQPQQPYPTYLPPQQQRQFPTLPHQQQQQQQPVQQSAFPQVPGHQPVLPTPAAAAPPVRAEEALIEL